MIVGAVRLCIIPGCGLPHRSRGYCSAHYRAAYRTGKLVLRPDIRRGQSERLPGVYVSKACAEKLRAQGPTMYRAIKRALEAWARSPGA